MQHNFPLLLHRDAPPNQPPTVGSVSCLPACQPGCLSDYTSILQASMHMGN